MEIVQADSAYDAAITALATLVTSVLKAQERPPQD